MEAVPLESSDEVAPSTFEVAEDMVAAFVTAIVSASPLTVTALPPAAAFNDAVPEDTSDEVVPAN